MKYVIRAVWMKIKRDSGRSIRRSRADISLTSNNSNDQKQPRPKTNSTSESYYRKTKTIFFLSEY